MRREQVSYKMFEIMPRLMQLVRTQVKIITKQEGLTFREFRVLANINRGLSHVGEIAEHQGVKQPVMSRLIECVVEKELVERSHDKNDRRKVNLKLTVLGKKKYKKIKLRASKKFSDEMGEISDTFLDELELSFNTLSTFLEKVQK